MSVKNSNDSTGFCQKVGPHGTFPIIDYGTTPATHKIKREKEKCPIKPVCQCDGDVGTDRQSEEASKFLRYGDKNDE
jgi:hypothetical protein